MPLSFTCPVCRAHLKIRDESLIGQTLECPDCHVALLVATTKTGEVIAQRIETEKSVASSEAKQNAAAPTPVKSARGSTATRTPVSRPARDSSELPVPPGLPTASRAPQIVAWSVALGGLVCLIPFLLPSKPKPAIDEQVAQEVATAKPSDSSEPIAPTVKEPVTPNPTELPKTPEGRMAALGRVVIERARKEGHFPAGTVPGKDLPVTQRWSWMAEIAASLDNPINVPVEWSQRWNAPAADRFVRRPIARFQNPLIEAQTSEDKYPAAHFVGVAGVGTDAPLLPVDHPRAGIFGQDRRTKFEHVRDGLTNTMLLAGVAQHPGSWADGSAGYRSFTREPYVNGTDGFGTGQEKSMFVLMADGSVKEISASIEPTLVRRMAAMNDGLPLDPKVPGEPANPSSPTPKPATQPDKPPQVAMTPVTQQGPQQAAPMPAAAIKPVPEVMIDIPAALSRKILSFDQSKPAPAFQLILQIEELAGVRIDYDREKLGSAAERLDRPITLKMQNATLHELLDKILFQIDLKRVDEKSQIRLVAPQI